MIRRILLFVCTNIAIIVMGTLVLWVLQRFFGIDISGRINASWGALAMFALFYGFFGAFISLWLSKWMAKRAYNMDLITLEKLHTFSPREQIIYTTVQNIAQREGITMPEVGIYASPEVNAFATGATKNSSLVAVSRGLVERMESGEIEGVVGHEMAHIINGDMVTMTLLQGIINAFVIFLSRAIAQIVATSGKDEGKSTLTFFLVTIVLEILLGLLGTLLALAFSRRREFAADAGSAVYLGKQKMIDALRALQKIHETNVAIPGDPKLAAFKIDGKTSGFMHLFASHPDLEARIKALQNR